MLHEEILTRCFAPNLATAQRQWRRVLKVSQHIPHRQYPTKHHGAVTIARIGSKTAKHQIILYTRGCGLDCLLLNALCSGLMLEAEETPQAAHAVILVHHLSPDMDFWPLPQRQEKSYHNPILQAASRRMQPPQSSLDLGGTSEMMTHDLEEISADWLGDCSKVSAINIRAGLTPYGIQEIIADDRRLMNHVSGFGPTVKFANDNSTSEHIWSEYLSDHTDFSGWDIAFGLADHGALLSLHHHRAGEFLALPDQPNQQQAMLVTLNSLLTNIINLAEGKETYRQRARHDNGGID